MSFTPVQFSKEHNQEFYKTLRKRVNSYFKEKNISRFGNLNMVLKSIFMVTLYITPFILILTVFESWWMVALMWVLMGFGMAGIGLSIMHDANHGAYSKNPKVNKFFGYFLNAVGGSDINWRIQHNVLHHTYTNVTGMDEDINPGGVMRFSPHDKRRKLHRLQAYYAWFFYGLMTIVWVTSKDYKQVFRYKKMNLLVTQGRSFAQVMTNIILSKVVYLGISLALPLIFSPVSWWFTILCFVMMHFIAGLSLALIFQPAHVVPTSDYPIPDESGNIEADWAVSQLYNTANFAPKARLFSWYVGGLNYQIEHHLFPSICHVHYRNISRIVKETAQEFHLPYNSNKTFLKAVVEHTKMLNNLGKYDNAPSVH